MKSKSVRKKVVNVPKDKLELERFVAGIREAEQKIKSIGEVASELINQFEIEIEAVKEEAQIKAKTFEEEIAKLADGVFIFAQGHREELTEDEKKKTVDFLSGDKIRWYFPPSSVVVKDEESAIAELKRRGLSEFIRTKETIDKTEILKDPDRIRNLKNISIDQTEIFAIVPAEMGIELQKGKRKFKKVSL